jgi:hypothetical protein
MGLVLFGAASAGAPGRADRCVPLIWPEGMLQWKYLRLGKGTLLEKRGSAMNSLDFVIGALIGLIDLNPLIDLVFVPLAWFLLWRG